MTDLEFAQDILRELGSHAAADFAADAWLEHADLDDASRWAVTLVLTAHAAISAILERRQSELARIGPWGHA